MTTVKSTCPYCGVGCGVLLTPDGKGGLTVKGDPDHPANFGRLCSKGSALAETVGTDHRLLAPRVDGQDTDWDSALDLVADRFRAVIDEHGPDAVAFYVSGQLLTEDYYVANKLMKGFIGSANIDTNSRLCMSSTVAGHKRAFGTDTVPGTYEDLEEADLIVLTGSNLAWCHPVLYQRILAARKARPEMKLVVIDPRRTASCDGADLHLKLAAGSDVALFNALLAEIDRRGMLNQDWLDAHVEGAEDAIASAHACDPAITGLSDADLQAFFDLWIGTQKVVTIFSQGVNQSSAGTDKVNAILNCHLATGRIGTLGCGPFSVTGQPNAMGGREVGGLANMLACHLDLENAEHRDAVQGFWSSPAMPEKPGLKAVDMFKALSEGRIKALWVIHSNPAVTLPDADKVRDAVKGCDFVVVSDITERTDTARLADVLLPASAWSEKSGTVTNSDRTISRQRTVLEAPGQAQPDWWIMAQVAQRMGYAGFDWKEPVEIFREYAALSGIAGQFGRDFDISNLSQIDGGAYDAMQPFRWPQGPAKEGGRFFADGAFYHAGGKAKMLALTHRPPVSVQDGARPFRLNTGRLRDQWHTMTRTALSPRLSAHLPEPFVDMHPEDAAHLGLKPADLVRLTSPHGTAILRLRQTDDVAKGDVFVPMHWTGETAPAARIDALVAPVVDPISGQPESKASTVSAEAFVPAWYGFAISTGDLTPDCAYWARARTIQGWRAELAGDATPEDWETYARGLFGLPDADTQVLRDAKRGTFRIAFFDGEILLAAFYAGPQPVILMRDFLAGLPGTETLWALAGQARGDTPDPGPVVCSCFAVGRNTIFREIEGKGLTTVEQIGACLSAGTNCGSCKSELAGLLASVNVPAE
ncbi:molybdopterin-dependent oxidoreductase [Donghicola sp. C2-DW-16]|uniref:Molybdopterin-dependent oxidoreductase n=1 Tax=Donghicola mangrovi TaxID=2729614 RepID=A0ABX2PEQ3_9RHOB|nr:nitrate reductase [Donghicola mangrovi]NVO27287.1 molybdopterin-dependent oxidoreductase [Donghicola mangrovi]